MSSLQRCGFFKGSQPLESGLNCYNRCQICGTTACGMQGDMCRARRRFHPSATTWAYKRSVWGINLNELQYLNNWNLFCHGAVSEWQFTYSGVWGHFTIAWPARNSTIILFHDLDWMLRLHWCHQGNMVEQPDLLACPMHSWLTTWWLTHNYNMYDRSGCLQTAEGSTGFSKVPLTLYPGNIGDFSFSHMAWDTRLKQVPYFYVH